MRGPTITPTRVVTNYAAGRFWSTHDGYTFSGSTRDEADAKLLVALRRTHALRNAVLAK